jgi:hypothetical protein
MKRYFICLLTVILALVLYNSLWAACPEDSIDLGICDTLYVEPWVHTDTCIIYKYAVPPHTDTICINNPGEKFPCFLYVNLFVTHDSNTFLAWPELPEERWVQDSIPSFTIFLGWTRTNPTAYCSLSTYWNKSVVGWWDAAYPRSIWRHFPQLGSDSLNRLESLAESGNTWSSMMLEMSSDSQHVFMTLIDIDKQRWWEGKRTLFATLTFRIEDTMTICIDSISKSADDHCGFVRYDGPFYFPRDNMPIGIRVNGDGSVDTCQCPGTDVKWIDGSTEENKPTTFLLSQNYPNPFNPVTNFKFSLPQASHVKIEIFNILGQKVKTLLDEDMQAGSFVVDWDGKDQRGMEVSSGIYFYRIIAGDFSSVKRMVLLK